MLRRPSIDPKIGGDAILVTANHVFDDIAGDFAIVYLTQKQADGTFIKLPHQIQIRKNGANLWTKHPTADIATMLFPLANTFVAAIDGIVNVDWLAGDASFQNLDLQPGDELSCLGFPFGLESNEAGFPILRSGKIASFPVYPTKVAPRLLLDIRIFGGNSGGPVFYDYASRRKFGTNLENTQDARGIAGVLVEDVSMTQKVEGYFETSSST